MDIHKYRTYIQDIGKVLKYCHNINLAIKALYVITITSGYKLVLEYGCELGSEAYFRNIPDTLQSNEYIVTRELRLIFNFRNKIAHTNDMIAVLHQVDMLDISAYEQEFRYLEEFIEKKESEVLNEIKVRQTMTARQFIDIHTAIDEVAVASDIIDRFYAFAKDILPKNLFLDTSVSERQIINEYLTAHY